MKKFIKILLCIFGSLVGLFILLIVVAFVWMKISSGSTAKKALALAGPEVQTITVDSFTFRDLNKNGKLDIYEDQEKSR